MSTHHRAWQQSFALLSNMGEGRSRDESEARSLPLAALAPRGGTPMVDHNVGHGVDPVLPGEGLARRDDRVRRRPGLQHALDVAQHRPPRNVLVELDGWEEDGRGRGKWRARQERPGEADDDPVHRVDDGGAGERRAPTE